MVDPNVDAGTIIETLEKIIADARAGEVLSVVVVCQRAHAPPSCNAIFTKGSSEAQMITSMYLGAIEMQIDLLLDRKLEERMVTPVYVKDAKG